jgi:hypothetical protein
MSRLIIVLFCVLCLVCFELDFTIYLILCLVNTRRNMTNSEFKKK